MPATTLAEALAAAGQEAEEAVVEHQPIQRISVICSKGTLDMAYPGLILANAARMMGIEAHIFFTFWGLDVVTEKKIDKLVGNKKRIAELRRRLSSISWFMGILLENIARRANREDGAAGSVRERHGCAHKTRR